MKHSFIASSASAAILFVSSLAAQAQAQPTYRLTPIDPGQTIEAIQPDDINDDGEVVGSLLVDGTIKAFLWRDGEMLVLPGLRSGPGFVSRGTGINERSDVVAFDADLELQVSRGFIFKQGELDEPVEINVAGAVSLEPIDINNRRDILGRMLDEDRVGHVFLRTASGEV